MRAKIVELLVKIHGNDWPDVLLDGCLIADVLGGPGVKVENGRLRRLGCSRPYCYSGRNPLVDAVILYIQRKLLIARILSCLWFAMGV